MQLTIGRNDGNRRLAAPSKRMEVRRLIGLLLAMAVAPPIVWALSGRVVQAEERSGRPIGDVGEAVAVAIPRIPAAEVAERIAARVSIPVEPTRVRRALPSPAEVYSSAPRMDDALRSERVRMAERALAIRSALPSAAEGVAAKEELTILAQADSPADLAAAAAPADDAEDDEEDDAPQAVDLSTLTPTRVVTPQGTTGGAAASAPSSATSTSGGLLPPQPTIDAGPVASPSRREAGEPSPGVVQSLSATEQPGSTGPREPLPSTAAAAESAVAQTRRRARTALHSAAAQAASSMVSDSPYRNALSGQSRFQAPSEDIIAIEDGLSRASETLSFLPGLHLQNVSFFGGYSSNGISNRLNSRMSVGSDFDYGASAGLGYIRNWRRTNLRMNYTPSHSRRSRFSEWNTTDHRLRLSAGRQLSRRWTVGGAASATNSGLESFWFEAPVYRDVEAPATFDEFYRMVENGELTDDEFAAILTGDPVVDDEGGQGFDLSRVLNVSASANAGYAYSPRLSFNVGARITDTQLLDDPTIGRRLSSIGRGTVRDIQRVSGSAGMSYSVNRRTNLTANFSQSQQSSSFRRNDTQQVTAGFNQTLGRSWSYGANFGIGAVTFGALTDDALLDPTFSQFQSVIEPRPTWTANGNLSYRVRAHRFSFQGGRSVGDTFGLGSRTSLRGRVGWNWSTRDSLWSANASASYTKSDSGLLGDLSNSVLTRTIGAGISRRVSPSTALQTTYYFGAFDSPFRGLFVNNSVHRLQASFIWSPAQLR